MPRGDPALLRPIGTEFEKVFPPVAGQAPNRWNRTVFRVMEHVIVYPFPGDGEGEWVEVVKVVKQEEVSVIVDE